MTTQELYRLLMLPEAAIARLEECAQADLPWLTPKIKAAYLNRAETRDGLEALQAQLGEDPDGFRILWVLLKMARETWEGYEQKGISRDVFAETMKFTTRALHTHMKQHGTYAFTLAWWFWRELAMVEYRIGCLEYELVENADGSREISLHIPSDADMTPASVDASFALFRDFLADQYPEWTEAPWVCDSWMMSPALEQLLPAGSNILAFQRRFQTLHVDEDSLGVLDWVFPPHQEVSERLPEDTSLQRRMKAWLLSGGKVGWTKAILRGS